MESKIRSKKNDGIIIYNTKEECLTNLVFEEIKSIHLLDDFRLVYMFNSNWKSIPNISKLDFKEIKNLYDNYQISKITLELMKSDPISNVADLKNRATEYYNLIKMEE